MSEQAVPRWSSRKLLIWIGCAITFTTLRVAGYLNEANYIAIMEPLIYAYFIANAAIHIAKGMKNNISISRDRSVE